MQDSWFPRLAVAGEQEPVSCYCKVIATAAVAVTTVFVAGVSPAAHTIMLLGAAALSATGQAFRKRLLLALPLPSLPTVLLSAGPECKPVGKGS